MTAGKVTAIPIQCEDSLRHTVHVRAASSLVDKLGGFGRVLSEDERTYEQVETWNVLIIID